jgi:acetyl esterase/lipase
VLNAYIAALPLRGPKSNRKHGKSTTHMITRREVVHGLCSASATAWLAAQVGINFSIVPIAAAAAKDDSAPPLAPVAPMSRKRMVLIDAFTKQSEGVQNRFEARTLNRDRAMPYRLFRPQASGMLPLVVYLHGSGGQGDDNLKQLGLGNIWCAHLAAPAEPKSFSLLCSRSTVRPRMGPL